MPPSDYMGLRGKGRPPKWRSTFVEIPGEEPESRCARLFAAERAALAPLRPAPPGRPRKYPEGYDKFSMRPGAIPGRCNAIRKKHPGKLCRRYPMREAKRCAFHGGRGLNGGWVTKRRRCFHQQDQGDT